MLVLKHRDSKDQHHVFRKNCSYSEKCNRVALPIEQSAGNCDEPFALSETYPEQTLKASNALLKHIQSEVQRKEATSSTKRLLISGNDSSDDASGLGEESLWLCFTTKKHIIDKIRLKPGKIALPHSLYNSTAAAICLITPDPQRSFKDTITQPSFPATLASRIRVIGISKLKARYKSFESRRQLRSEYDIFLADDRIITLLPNILGKVFYEGSKRPVPVKFEPYRQKDKLGKRLPLSKNTMSKPIAPPPQVAREVEKTLGCTQVHLSPSVSVSIRVALASFTPMQVAENIEAVVNGMIEKFIPKGWKNMRSIHVKGPNTMALPVWLAKELWVEEKDVLEDEEAKPAIQLASQKGRKRKGREGETNELSTKVKKLEDTDFSKEMAERRAKLRQQKKEAREVADGASIALEKDVSMKIPAIKTKVKTKKSKIASVSI